jgi:general secretion pathway protein K
MTARGPLPRQDDGFILVVVLLLLMALAALASVYSVYAGDVAAESLVPEDRLQGEAAARAAVELAALETLARPAGERPTRGRFSVRLAKARIEARYVAETARVDLNAAPKELLSGLFASLGAEKALADRLADGVVAWRSKPQQNEAPPPDSAEYKALGLSYGPRHGLFDSVFELSLIAGMPPAIAARALPLVTLYSGRAELDVADADPLAIAALPGLEPDAVAAIVKARSKGADFATLQTLLGEAKDGATGEAGAAYRLDVDVELRNRRMRAEIVFALKSEGAEPYDILYWRDDFDGPTPEA